MRFLVLFALPVLSFSKCLLISRLGVEGDSFCSSFEDDLGATNLVAEKMFSSTTSRVDKLERAANAAICVNNIEYSCELSINGKLPSSGASIAFHSMISKTRGVHSVWKFNEFFLKEYSLEEFQYVLRYKNLATLKQKIPVSVNNYDIMLNECETEDWCSSSIVNSGFKSAASDAVLQVSSIRNDVRFDGFAINFKSDHNSTAESWQCKSETPPVCNQQADPGSVSCTCDSSNFQITFLTADSSKENGESKVGIRLAGIGVIVLFALTVLLYAYRKQVIKTFVNHEKKDMAKTVDEDTPEDTSEEEETCKQLSLLRILESKKKKEDFRYFLTTENATENLLFYESIELYEMIKRQSWMAQAARGMIQRFVQDYSPHKVELPPRIKNHLCSLKHFDSNSFSDAKLAVYNIMNEKYFPEFTSRSKETNTKLVYHT